MPKHPPDSPWSVTVIALLLGLITALLAWTLAVRDDKPRSETHDPPVAAITSPPRPPNVVIFLIDTLRADRLGAYGYGKPTSPHIDELARTSVVFENAYAPAPWTLPSVVSLFTSTFPCEHGVLADGQRARTDHATLAQRLKTRGYTTASFHANPYAGKASGMDAGFDRADLVPVVDGPLVDEWLDTLDEEPFFLYIHNLEPHDPYRAPRRLIDRFGRVPEETCVEIGGRLLSYRKLTRVDFAAGHALGTTDNTQDQITAMDRIAEYAAELNTLYDAAVRDADEKVGRVIAVLKRRNQWENTLFLLLSDHGEEFGDHGRWQHDQSVYEELVRVPLIVHRPGPQEGPTRVAGVASLVDVMPTILDLVGAEDACADCAGTSLRGHWTVESDRGGPRLAIPTMRWNTKKYFRPHKETRGDLNVVVRLGEWKAIFNAEPRTLELYDLGEDAGERRDLAADHPALVEMMQLEAREWIDACRTRAEGRAVPIEGYLDERQRERLRTLGYME